MSNFAVNNQPRPSGGKESVTDLVIKDLELRREMGKQKYGSELMTENGRDSMVDLYQELLDACLYARQVLEERITIVDKKSK